LPIIAPYVHGAVDDGRRGDYEVSGREVPPQLAGGGVEGVDVVVIAPHIHDAVGDAWGRGTKSPVVKFHISLPVVALRA